MPDGRDTQSGISWRDVSELFDAVGRHYAGDVHSRFTVPMRTGSGLLFWVHVTFVPRALSLVQERAGCTVSGRWPGNGAATMAGLLFKLGHELESELDRRVAELERERSGQQSLF